MLSKTEALVLHSIKYGESRVIVDMFTRRYGRLSFIVSLPKTSHGRLKKQYFQPLTLLTIELDYRQQAQLQKLRDASLLMPLPSLQGEPSKLAIILFLSEFLYHALHGEQQNEPLFDYILTSLQWLDGKQADFANFHLVVLMHLSRFLGFYPNLDYKGEDFRLQTTDLKHQTSDIRPQTSAITPLYFDLRAASFCSVPPLHRDFLMPEEASMLQLMMRMDFVNMHLFRMNRQQRNRCIEVALLFYRLHLPDFPDLRSLDVLRELF